MKMSKGIFEIPYPHIQRCGFLSSRGRQCMHDAIHATNYHGDGELYNDCRGKDTATWVRVPFCDKHIKSFRR